MLNNREKRIVYSRRVREAGEMFHRAQIVGMILPHGRITKKAASKRNFRIKTFY